MSLVSREKVNTGRQIELDLLRGFTLIILIICHVGLYLGDNSNAALYTFSDIIGSETGAPIFMALMGICMSYTSKPDPKNMVRRGFKLFLIGIIISMFRSLIPYLLFGEIDPWATLEGFFVIDIMELSGVSFMLFGLFKKIKTPNWVIFLISIIMVILGQFYMSLNITIENPALQAFLNLFVPVNEWSCFPLITWFVFPCFGLVLGDLLIRCPNKDKFYGVLLPISFIGVAFVYGEFIYYYPDYAYYVYYGHSFYYMGITNVLFTFCFIIFYLGLWYFINKILPKIIKKYLIFLSINITEFYVVSWFYISILIHVFIYIGYTANLFISIILMIVLQVLCSYTVVLYNIIKKKIKNNIKRRKENNERNINQ